MPLYVYWHSHLACLQVYFQKIVLYLLLKEIKLILQKACNLLVIRITASIVHYAVRLKVQGYGHWLWSRFVEIFSVDDEFSGFDLLCCLKGYSFY